MKTHITFVLDSSGSMESIKEDTIGGFNSFLHDQKSEEGTATVSLYNFDTDVECIYETKAIENAPALNTETYTPGGQTALHDAIATAVNDTTDHIASVSQTERPDNVIIVILTDGKENASETPQETVRELVEQRREKHGWEFLFIGANQDAALTASKMGMDRDRSLSMDHSGDGTRNAYESTSERISDARREGTTGGYSDEDRRKQDDTDES